jgi:hypothetical protein
MAILPTWPGIKISITCNGAILQEYNDDDDEPQPGTVTKYIESISGAEFGIHWDITSPWPPYTVLFEYFLDQKKASGKYAKSTCFKHPSFVHVEEGATSVVNGQGYLHKFSFAPLTIGEYLTNLGSVED